MGQRRRHRNPEANTNPTFALQLEYFRNDHWGVRTTTFRTFDRSTMGLDDFNEYRSFPLLSNSDMTLQDIVIRAVVLANPVEAVLATVPRTTIEIGEARNLAQLVVSFAEPTGIGITEAERNFWRVVQAAAERGWLDISDLPLEPLVRIDYRLSELLHHVVDSGPVVTWQTQEIAAEYYRSHTVRDGNLLIAGLSLGLQEATTFAQELYPVEGEPVPAPEPGVEETGIQQLPLPGIPVPVGPAGTEDDPLLVDLVYSAWSADEPTWLEYAPGAWQRLMYMEPGETLWFASTPHEAEFHRVGRIQIMRNGDAWSADGKFAVLPDRHDNGTVPEWVSEGPYVSLHELLVAVDEAEQRFVDRVVNARGEEAEEPRVLLQISLDNADRDDGMVLVTTTDAAGARNDQSIAGTDWEFLDSGNFAYATVLDDLGLVGRLVDEIYGLDLTNYTPPGGGVEDEIERARRLPSVPDEAEGRSASWYLARFAPSVADPTKYEFDSFERIADYPDTVFVTILSILYARNWREHFLQVANRTEVGSAQEELIDAAALAGTYRTEQGPNISAWYRKRIFDDAPDWYGFACVLYDDDVSLTNPGNLLSRLTTHAIIDTGGEVFQARTAPADEETETAWYYAAFRHDANNHVEYDGILTRLAAGGRSEFDAIDALIAMQDDFGGLVRRAQTVPVFNFVGASQNLEIDRFVERFGVYIEVVPQGQTYVYRSGRLLKLKVSVAARFYDTMEAARRFVRAEGEPHVVTAPEPEQATFQQVMEAFGATLGGVIGETLLTEFPWLANLAVMPADDRRIAMYGAQVLRRIAELQSPLVRPEPYMTLADVTPALRVNLQAAHDRIVNEHLQRILLVGHRGAGARILVGNLLTELAPVAEQVQAATEIYRAGGWLEPHGNLNWPVLRAPHHTVSQAAMHGARGRPGEVSLAHAGILLLDELGEFDRRTIRTLAADLEAGIATHSHRREPVMYPVAPAFVIGVAYSDDERTIGRAVEYGEMLGMTEVYLELETPAVAPTAPVHEGLEPWVRTLTEFAVAIGAYTREEVASFARGHGDVRGHSLVTRLNSALNTFLPANFPAEATWTVTEVRAANNTDARINVEAYTYPGGPVVLDHFYIEPETTDATSPAEAALTRLTDAVLQELAAAPLATPPADVEPEPTTGWYLAFLTEVPPNSRRWEFTGWLVQALPRAASFESVQRAARVTRTTGMTTFTRRGTEQNNALQQLDAGPPRVIGITAEDEPRGSLVILFRMRDDRRDEAQALLAAPGQEVPRDASWKETLAAFATWVGAYPDGTTGEQIIDDDAMGRNKIATAIRTKLNMTWCDVEVESIEPVHAVGVAGLVRIKLVSRQHIMHSREPGPVLARSSTKLHGHDQVVPEAWETWLNEFKAISREAYTRRTGREPFEAAPVAPAPPYEKAYVTELTSQPNQWIAFTLSETGRLTFNSLYISQYPARYTVFEQPNRDLYGSGSIYASWWVRPLMTGDGWVVFIRLPDMVLHRPGARGRIVTQAADEVAALNRALLGGSLTVGASGLATTAAAGAAATFQEHEHLLDTFIFFGVYPTWGEAAEVAVLLQEQYPALGPTDDESRVYLGEGDEPYIEFNRVYDDVHVNPARGR